MHQAEDGVWANYTQIRFSSIDWEESNFEIKNKETSSKNPEYVG